MKPLVLAWLWLVFMGCIICNPPKKFVTGVKSFDIPRVIDSIHQLYRNYKTYRSICSESIDEVIIELGFEGYDDIWMDVTRFVYRMKDLRMLLLTDDLVEKDIVSNIKDPFIFAMISVFTMKDVIDDLRPRIIEWKKQGISNIKEDIPFQWFNYHRFTKEMLKDVTLDALEQSVENMYKADIFSKKLLEFGGTILFLKAECHPYILLPWLATIYNNSTMTDLIANYLKNQDSVTPSVSTGIMNALTSCRGKEHTVGQLFDAYNRKELYSLYMNIYSHASIEEKHVERCKHMMVILLKEIISNPSYIELKRSLQKCGASLNRVIIPGFSFIRKSGSDDCESEDKNPSGDGSSSDAEIFPLYDEEELGFVGPDRTAIDQPEINEKTERRKYRKNAVRGKRGKKPSKRSA